MDLCHPDNTQNGGPGPNPGHPCCAKLMLLKRKTRPAERGPGSSPGRFATQPRIAKRFFPGLVVIARAKHPIPSRSRQLSAVAPMVLHLKVWESRSPPNLIRNALSPKRDQYTRAHAAWSPRTRCRQPAKPKGNHRTQIAMRKGKNKVSRDGAAR